MPTHRKRAAILSADAVGYSKLMCDDEATTLRSLNEVRASSANASKPTVGTSTPDILAPLAFDLFSPSGLRFLFLSERTANV